MKVKIVSNVWIGPFNNMKKVAVEKEKKIHPQEQGNCILVRKWIVMGPLNTLVTGGVDNTQHLPFSSSILILSKQFF